MRKFTQRCLMLMTVLTLTSFTDYDSVNFQTVYIKMYVDTANIKSGKKATEYCTFKQPSSVTNEDYTVKVKKGDIVIWQGISSSDSINDVVNITSIKHDSGKELFGSKTIKGNGAEPELVIGQVVSGTLGDIEKYKIKFTVLNNGVKRNRTYVIDPRLSVYW